MNSFLFSLATSICVIPLLCFAQDEDLPHKSPQEIQAELDEDEKLFQEAKDMFNPWYAGPLLTGSAHMMPPGSMNIQPYIFVTDNYAAWNKDRKTVDVPDRVVFNPTFGALIGVTNWMDLAINLQGFVNWQSGKSSGGFGDMNITLGFPILQEGLYVPAIKVSLGETFPTGTYQGLNPNKYGLDSTGAGSYQTAIGLRLSKLVFWSARHPMNFRLALTYTMPSIVHVHGFNSYGGGHGAHGRVHPGNSFSADAAIEYSFTQKWVFATDAVYTCSNHTTFSGNPGTTNAGLPSFVGGGSSDQLSFAPALEYNPTPNLGFLGGVWFDVYGRNTSKFVSGIVTVTYTISW